MKIAIIGLGYVGLPLSLQFARSGVVVLGLDIDPARVDALNQGRSYIKHAPPESVADAIRSGTFIASTDFERIKEVSAIIICVPTTLNKNCEPDISFIINTGRTIARHLQTGTLVVLESPTYPGAADDDLLEVLEVGSGLEVGRDFHLAFSAERGDPGNPEGNVAFMPKVIGGRTEACSEKARALYSMAVNGRASVVLSRGGANEAAQKNFAQREHCAGA
jgi:UDP-N-acetyl-D-glucosamine dehydrogenase